MDIQDLEKNLKALRKITPNSEWKKELKFEILKEQKKNYFEISLPFNWTVLSKALVLGIIVIVALMGLFRVEKGKVVLLPNGNTNYLALAEKSLEEMEKLAENDGKEILIAKKAEIEEILKKAVETLPKSPDNIQKTKQIVEKVTKINQKAKKLQNNLGIQIKETKTLTSKTAELLKNEIDETSKKIVERELAELKSSSLSEEQKKMLEKAEELYFEGKYQEALIKILELTNLR
ncbi:MAG TPA: hypothetical protein ENF31_00260 [bacterium]|nr:hypothetical protein [bacterium]